MASMAITSSIFGSKMSLSKLPSSTTPTRRVMVVTSAKASEMKEVEISGSSKRRDLVFAAAAVAACALAKVAMAADEEEPKRGTPAAKKKYGPVCVTNPTARICRY